MTRKMEREWEVFYLFFWYIYIFFFIFHFSFRGKRVLFFLHIYKFILEEKYEKEGWKTITFFFNLNSEPYQICPSPDREFFWQNGMSFWDLFFCLAFLLAVFGLASFWFWLNWNLFFLYLDVFWEIRFENLRNWELRILCWMDGWYGVSGQGKGQGRQRLFGGSSSWAATLPIVASVKDERWEMRLKFRFFCSNWFCLACDVIDLIVRIIDDDGIYLFVWPSIAYLIYSCKWQVPWQPSVTRKLSPSLG